MTISTIQRMASSSSSPPSNEALDDFVSKMPKVELHLHIEGTLEPELWMTLAKKNKVKTRFESVQELRAAYDTFSNLDSFLELYYEGMQVLHEEEDFYALTRNYLSRVHKENVVHTEIFFDPQPHLQRGIEFGTIVNGIHRALQEALTEYGLTSKLIMCFVRHLSVQDAFATLELSLPYRNKIYGVGLDSTEKDKPPELYQQLFDKARDDYGYVCVAHAGEEGPPTYVWGALKALQAQRIDHGVRSTQDEDLMRHLTKTQTPLTVCPLSNVKLRVFGCLRDHTLPQMLQQGVCVTINSDDPAFFESYITDNFKALHWELGFQKEQHIQLVRNSIEACFLTRPEKDLLHRKLDTFVQEYGDL